MINLGRFLLRVLLAPLLFAVGFGTVLLEGVRAGVPLYKALWIAFVAGLMLGWAGYP